MAKANPANAPAEKPKKEEKEGPVIEYYGDGAKDVKFEVDQRATRIRVYESGIVLVDY